MDLFSFLMDVVSEVSFCEYPDSKGITNIIIVAIKQLKNITVMDTI